MKVSSSSFKFKFQVRAGSADILSASSFVATQQQTRCLRSQLTSTSNLELET